MNFPEKILLKLKKTKYTNKYSRLSFSQEGEDMVLAELLHGKKNGTYVDVGAYHPMKFSNTYHFYLKGWKGINIEARPHAMDLFNLYRPNDINLEIAVSDTKQELTYFMFDEPALNGFSSDLSKDRDTNTSFNIVSEIKMTTMPLSEILDMYLPGNNIDFMSIDVEGMDYKVLISNNWSKYRPTYVLVEDIKSTNLAGSLNSETANFMKQQNYELLCRTQRTMFFKTMLTL
jgi:FkbM family methyltransferase